MSETFKHHELDEEQSNVNEMFCEVAEELEAHIVLHCTPSREKSLALTKLEECVMWASKALAIHGIWDDFEGC